MSDKNSKKVFIGPSKESWWKFKIAGILWIIVGGYNSWRTNNIPILKRIARWCFKVRVMSRDFEISE